MTIGQSISRIPGPVSIPSSFRLTITTMEPVIALSGAIQALLSPSIYMASMTRGAVDFSPPMEFLHTELGGAWLYFAFIEAVVLRISDDERLWRFLCAGMLLSDLAWCHSVAQAVGGWRIWTDITIWSAADHFMFWTSAPIAIMRLLIVLGVASTLTSHQPDQGNSGNSNSSKCNKHHDQQ